MNKSILLILTALISAAGAQTTVSTPIVGFSKVTVPAGTRAVVPGFVKPSVFSGSGTVTGQSIAATGLTAGAFQPTQFTSGAPNFPTHYVEIISGSYEGYSFDIDSNTTSAVTVSGLPGALNGTSVSYVIRPHLKVGDIDYAALPDGQVVVNVYNNPNLPATTYLYDSGGNWYDGSGSFLMNHAVIYPGTGISLNNSSTSFEIKFMGQVKPTKTAVPVYASASVNLVGPMNPSASSVLSQWAVALPDQTVANILSTTGDNGVSMTLLTDTGSTALYDGGGNPLSQVALDGQNAFGMSAMTQDGYVIFNSPLNP